MITEVEAYLKTRFVDRDEAIRVAILALLCKEHVFFLGPVGSGKSSLCRETSAQFDNATYFESSFSEWTPAESVLGPIDLPALRDKGSYLRIGKGFLPFSDLAVVDEIQNAAPSLAHELLNVLGDRVIHYVDEQSRSRHDIPLHTCFATGNSVPPSPALWDRFLFRTSVAYVTDSSFTALLEGPNARSAYVMPMDRLKEHALMASQVEVPSALIETIRGLKKCFTSTVISDRRWVNSIKAIQAAAYLRGSNMAELCDLYVFKYTLWSKAADESLVREIVDKYIKSKNSDGYKLLKELATIEAGAANTPSHALGAYVVDSVKKLAAIHQRLETYKGSDKANIRDEFNAIRELIVSMNPKPAAASWSSSSTMAAMVSEAKRILAEMPAVLRRNWEPITFSSLNSADLAKFANHDPEITAAVANEAMGKVVKIPAFFLVDESQSMMDNIINGLPAIAWAKAYVMLAAESGLFSSVTYVGFGDSDSYYVQRNPGWYPTETTEHFFGDGSTDIGSACDRALQDLLLNLVQGEVLILSDGDISRSDEPSEAWVHEVLAYKKINVTGIFLAQSGTGYMLRKFCNSVQPLC